MPLGDNCKYFVGAGSDFERDCVVVAKAVVLVSVLELDELVRSEWMVA